MYDELIYKLEELVCDRIKDTDDAMLVCDAINAINALMSKPRWIPVAEALPNTGDEVVVAFKNSEDGEWWYRIDNFVDGAFCYNAAFGRNITHWTPLPPEPPKEET